MNVRETIAAIQREYRADNRPWVIGFSGGKDSTASLQLVWQAVLALGEGARRKPVYIISSDTLVESPVVAASINASLAGINAQASAQGLPFSASLVQPLIDESFWVNIIGRGYPAPSNKFRWCTDRLKISPANRFIKEQVARFGEVVLVLGVRKAESSTRAQVMALHAIEGSALRTHSTLAGALVLAPIEDWTTSDVWSYLLQNAYTPWGTDNNDLAAMYKSADAECPLVVDTTTPSCGNSRFGCWVCTVVSRDKSMEAMVDAGQSAWMEQLLEIRDMLAATQTGAGKKSTRSIRKLDGRILLKYNGDEAALGPYTFDFCKEILAKLLSTQTNLPDDAGNFELISEAELLAIRRLWIQQRHDWEDSLPKIYESSTGRGWHAIADVSSPVTDDANIIQTVCDEHNVPSLLLKRLLDAERNTRGLKRRAGIYERLSAILDEDWRSPDQVDADIKVLRGG